jgi:hypothetical protein
MHDYGFDLPDTRHGFYDTDGHFVAVRIVRSWHSHPEDPEEVDYDCSFDIIRGSDVTHLPVGIDESRAVTIAHEMYEEDREATEGYNEIEAEYAAERRMGA